MKEEYETLRTEILQIYGEQSRVFAVVVVALIAFSISKAAGSITINLPAILILLFGVQLRMWANYRRIFRIGAYIVVVHERKGMLRESFAVELTDLSIPAWHHRWRWFANKKGKYSFLVGNEGPTVDGLFICCVAVIGWVVAFPKNEPDDRPVDLILSIVVSVLLVIGWYLLYKIKNSGRRIEKEFEKILDEEKELSKNKS